MRIGVVDLDTSHPQNWIPIERELGYEVVGIWDGGSVHPPSYVEQFASERGIPVFHSLKELAKEVDCAIIHSCDWDTHVEKARPFVEAGKGVLIDKPIAGNLRDIKQLLAWGREGARISGGSSLRFCYETQAWLAKDEAERGTPHTVLAGCSTDEFNYGIHAYAMLSGILGPGVRSVRHLGHNVQHRLEIRWEDGRLGLLSVGAAQGYLPFYATIVTGKGVTHYTADSSKLYRALLEATLPYLGGEADTPPVSLEALLEPELCALAARKSWASGDREVLLSALSEDDKGYDGATFAAEYRKAKYG